MADGEKMTGDALEADNLRKELERVERLGASAGWAASESPFTIARKLYAITKRQSAELSRLKAPVADGEVATWISELPEWLRMLDDKGTPMDITLMNSSVSQPAERWLLTSETYSGLAKILRQGRALFTRLSRDSTDRLEAVKKAEEFLEKLLIYKDERPQSECKACKGTAWIGEHECSACVIQDISVRARETLASIAPLTKG